MEGKVIMEARGVSKRWPGVLALDKVDFRVYAGAVNALCGENGAGKSTLMNILSGVYPDYEGDVLLDGKKVSFGSTAEAFAAGIAMVHQELNLIPGLDIAENIFLGREPHNALGMIDYRKMHKDAALLLERLGFGIPTRTRLSDLKVGQQQLVEIAKALSTGARVLIMDEPTSSLSGGETDILFKLIASLKAGGTGIVYITHKMDEISRLADYVTVLRDGRLVEEMPFAQTSVDGIVRMMVGRERSDLYTKQEHPKGDILFSAKDIRLIDSSNKARLKVDGVSFDVHSGEVLGIYGLMGAGRTELAETVFGMHPDLASGSVSITPDGKLPGSPSAAISCGLALIPEDRKNDGLVLGMDISRNITLPSLRTLFPFLIDSKKETSVAGKYRGSLGIKSHSLGQKAGELSGGNQQKVVLAKWLLTEPRILILDEPTRGIDIAAKSEIYKLIDSLAAEGRAMVVISSELPEIMAISDRIITLCGGRLTGEFLPADFTEENILKASLPQNQ